MGYWDIMKPFIYVEIINNIFSKEGGDIGRTI